jgi:membrane fusion protein (multidrug efflux system)
MFAQAKSSLAGIALLLSLPLMVQAAPPNKKGPPMVEVMSVSRASVPQVFTAIATLRADEAITLKSEVAGRVTAIRFTEGQQVKKGQLLVQLDTDLLSAELAQTKANLDLAQSEYARYQSLYKEQQVSAIDYERKKAEVAQAQAAMNLVQAKLRQKEIRAPFTGVIGLRQFSVGDVLQANQALVSLTSFSPLKADIKIPETSSSKINLKQSITFTVDAIPNLVLNGQVVAMESSLDSSSRAVVVRAAIPHGDSRIKAGMTARASLQLSTLNEIVIPEQALVAQRGKFVVFTVKGELATAVPVVVGARQTGKVAIVSGLHVGDVIVVSGQNKLSKPEMPIKPVPMQGGL